MAGGSIGLHGFETSEPLGFESPSVVGTHTAS